MKLYLFATSNWSEPKLTVEEFEVEEKNKTYFCESLRRRFNKSDIGHVSGYSNDECLLLEKDAEKAASVLLSQKERELEAIQRSYDKKQAEIDNLKRYIK